MSSKTHIKLIVWGVCMLMSNLLLAQQTPEFSQYMYSTQLYNPAYTGTKDYLNLNLFSRLQWNRISGSPLTNAVSIQKGLKNWPVGIGGTFMIDRAGPVDLKNFAIDASYTIKPNDESRLAFGLKMGLEVLSIDLSRGNAEDPNDPLLTPIDSKFTPNLGAGAYWYGEDWYVGLSALNLLQAKLYDTEITDRPHYYFIGGYVTRLDRDLKFKPAIITKLVSGAPISVSASANFLINERFTLGVSYDFGNAISGLAYVDVNSVFSIGYSYDYAPNKLNQFSGATHEVVLSYRFTKSAKTPSCHSRFF